MLAGQTLTFSDAVTATTIANYGTLLFNATSTLKQYHLILLTTEQQLFKLLIAQMELLKLLHSQVTVAADTITIGTTAKAGSALFNGTVSGTNINIVGGDAAQCENSLSNFANTVTVTAITLDDNTATASATFSGTTATITGTINGVSYN